MPPRLIAYYLPQYHPIPENDAWWGKGFTEWTNVVKAKPLFKGHYQPRLPADLGFYDLRVPEVREQQAELAREHGIYGFCYYHYWFGNGKQLLERPFNEVLVSGKPDFPFMLCWANQTWKGVWFGASKGRVLIEQYYPGKQDYQAHFDYLIKAFNDKRYITINNKPVFIIYYPTDIPNIKQLVDIFREKAHQAGLPGLYLLGDNLPRECSPEKLGLNGVVSSNFQRLRHDRIKLIFKNRDSVLSKLEYYLKHLIWNIYPENRTKPITIDYKTMVEMVCNYPQTAFDYYPMIVPDWDNSARTGRKSLIIKGASIELWEKQIIASCKYTSRFSEVDKKLVFIKSWNEWAEGNYLEPDTKWGLQFLKAIKSVIEDYD